jgi:hypothetical protein
MVVSIAFAEVGGYNELIRKFFLSYPSENYTAYDINGESCAKIPADSMHLFRSNLKFKIIYYYYF